MHHVSFISTPKKLHHVNPVFRPGNSSPRDLVDFLNLFVSILGLIFMFLNNWWFKWDSCLEECIGYYYNWPGSRG